MVALEGVGLLHPRNEVLLIAHGSILWTVKIVVFGVISYQVSVIRLGFVPVSVIGYPLSQHFSKKYHLGRK
jgi:hypothetical protein